MSIFRITPAVAFFALCFCTLPLEAGEKKTLIFGTAWGMTLSLDGTGFYNEIAYDLLDEVPASVAYRIRPYRRAKVSFFGNKNSCLFPSSLSALSGAGQIKEPKKFIESDGLFIARTHLFVRSGETPPASFEDLFGKTVAYPNGSVVRSMLEGYGARLISVNDEADKAEMLRSGRVDIISGMLPDTALVFRQLESELPTYDPGLVLNEVPVTLVCHKTPGNEQLVSQVNKALSALSQNAVYMARLSEARVALGALARKSGDIGLASEAQLNAIAPAAGGKKKPARGSSGRRVANRLNR